MPDALDGKTARHREIARRYKRKGRPFSMAALRSADGDETVGSVVLTGRGSAFTSGQDLAEMAAIATGTAVEGAGQGFMGLLDALNETSVPLLAAVNGVAVGLGFTLLAHCDIVLVDAGARLRVPFAELGVPAEAASSLLIELGVPFRSVRVERFGPSGS